MKEPIIFIGMHRSGTSLLGRLLEECGLFVGKRKDQNNESELFKKFNNWLMFQCGARWDNPGATGYLWSTAHAEALKSGQDYIDLLLRSPMLIEYLGIRHYLRHRSLHSLDFPWGWKDPRNTFTLPFWTSLFPEAKVIFIERHGVDVAESLRVRAHMSIGNIKKRFETYKPFAIMRFKKGGFSDSPRCMFLEGGFSLWQEYQQQAFKLLEGYPENLVYRIRYEELIANPEEYVSRICAFIGIEPQKEKIKKVCSSINCGRAYSYRSKSKLVEFSVDHQDALKLWGYSA